MEWKAKITSKGQVTIPREVRRRLRLREGDFLVFETDEGGDVRLRAQWDQPDQRFARYEGSWREGDGMTIEEVNDYVRGMRGQEE